MGATESKNDGEEWRRLKPLDELRIDNQIDEDQVEKPNSFQPIEKPTVVGDPRMEKYY